MGKVLQAGSAMPALEKELVERYGAQSLAKVADVPRFLAQHGKEFEVLVSTIKTGADAAIMDALPNLKAITHFGVGYETVDVAAATKRGIVVSNTPDVLNDCVADTAMGLMIDTARTLSAAERFLRRGDWLKGPYPVATRISGKKLGIAGLGRIGQTIARRAGGFDMDIRYHTRRPVDGVPYLHEPSLKALAEWADFLMVVVSGGPSTRHLISAEILRALGPDGFLINVSRGSVVDEAALVDALVNKKIAGAGLDVYENEPHVPPALLPLDHVVLYPHVGSGTRETRKAMADTVLANVRSWFENQKLVTPVPD